jgi:hypothetical protein
VQLSQEDRSRKRQAITRLISMTKEADTTRRRAVAMRTALTNLTETWESPNAPAVPDSIRKTAADLLSRVKTAAGIFEVPGGRGAGGGSAGPPAPYTPPPVTQKIGRVLAAIDGYSSAPTSRQMADIEEAAEQLKKGAAEVDRLWDEVPKLNKAMVDAGVPYFTVNVNTVPAPAAGARGGN